jgi:AraC family transcriptional regulator of adaptative response / DNA-3-methyladenine glycosylase II
MVSAVAPRRVPRDAYQLAVDARDSRFDGVFFVGITTTHVYCRPCCPSRLAYDRHRRFFDSAAAAERAGFRPCLRCRPELAPGRSQLHAVSQLARLAAQRIAAGALNGRTVADLARELGVSERHLRRALEREISVSPLELAQTHRLLLAKRLIVDTDLPMTRVAYASGFQSLRRFNAVFREQYRMAPSTLRRGRRSPAPAAGSLRLTLAYRPPLAWEVLMRSLPSEATLSIDGYRGVVTLANSPAEDHLIVHIEESLCPVLMPLTPATARLRSRH